MKKLLVMCLFLAACAVSVSAQPYEYYRPYTDFDVMDQGRGLQKNTTRVEFYGGVADPSGSRQLGDTGFSAGIGFTRNIWRWFGLGLDANFTGLGAGDVYTVGTTTLQNTRSGIATGLFTGRLNLFPSSPTRFYIPAGIGVGHAYSTQKNQNLDTRTTISSTDVAWMVGVGLEFDIDETMVFGVEARYNNVSVNDKYQNNGSFDKSAFKYFSALLKLGVKF